MPFRLSSLGLGALLCALVPAGSFAASPATQALLDNLVPNVDFLDRSSRLALDHARSARIKAFARGQAREQTTAIDALYDWTQGGQNFLADASASRRPLPAAAVKPLDATPTGSTGPAASRRMSWPPHGAAPAAADARLPRGQEDLDSLEGLDGAAFDADFKTEQADALAQVESDYATYLAAGDDPALLALAKAELPKVRAALAALKTL